MDRTGFIGGSDCVKIMDGQWYELWEIKTGRKQPEDLSHLIHIELGRFTEPFNLQWLEKETGWSATETQIPYAKGWGDASNHDASDVISNKIIVPMQGTVDAIGINDQGEKAIIECKHTNAFTTMDKQVEYYMPQIQCYLDLADMDLCIFSVIFGNSKHQATAITRDHNYISAMRKEVLDFWTYVKNNQEPDVSLGKKQDELMNTKNKLLNAIPVDNMIKRDATLDNHFGMLASDFIANKSSSETYENAKKGLKEIIKPNEREVFNDFITVKRDKRGAVTVRRRTQDGK